jgi:uncharacterized protein YkwD
MPRGTVMSAARRNLAGTGAIALGTAVALGALSVSPAAASVDASSAVAPTALENINDSGRQQLPDPLRFSNGFRPAGAAAALQPADAAVAPAAVGNIVNDSNRQQVIDVFRYINEFRASKGLNPVSYNIYISDMAQNWTEHLAATGTWDINPHGGDNTVLDPRLHDWWSGGELVAVVAGQSARDLVDVWIDSPEHNEMLSVPGFTTVGIGIAYAAADDYGTVMFATVDFFEYRAPVPGTYSQPADYIAEHTYGRFIDVAMSNMYFREIEWLAERGISTGWTEFPGSVSFRPYLPIGRDAMAAFLYRMAGEPDYAPPAASPFIDVRTDHAYYKQIAWLADTGISTGWTEADGTRTFRPDAAIDRDAMAAFLYRLAGRPAYTAPAVSPFTDVAPGVQFYKEMAWLASEGISTGWTEANGTKTYRPWTPVNRDAMAAFLYRFDTKGLRAPAAP